MTLTANAQGQISGKFRIPANVPAGAKRVAFEGNQGSLGEARFVGEGEIVTRNMRTVNTITRTLQAATRPVDPLAQTFRLEQGRHVTGLDLAFKVRGSTANNVVVQIRETTVGIPNDNLVTEGIILGSSISTTGWTKATFTRPTYLEANVEYAIVLLTDDPDHAVAIAQSGKFDSTANQWVTSQAYTVGVFLKSSNASTWTPVQDTDLTFRLYGARFTNTSRTVDLGDIFQAAVTGISRSGTTATATAPGHGFTTGQKVLLYGADQSGYNGAFTVTVVDANTFTFTVSGSPMTPATGTIRAVVGDVTDLLTLAGVDRINNSTDVEFIYTLADGTQIRGADNARIRLNEVLNQRVNLSAVLRGTVTESPYLFAGTQAVYGVQRATGTYITRAIPCAANARVTITYEAILPGTSGVTVEVEKADGTWQAQAVTSTAAVGDGWFERIHTISGFAAGGTTTRVRLTLEGTAADRPQVRQLRVVVI